MCKYRVTGLAWDFGIQKGEKLCLGKIPYFVSEVVSATEFKIRLWRWYDTLIVWYWWNIHIPVRNFMRRWFYGGH